MKRLVMLLALFGCGETPTAPPPADFAVSGSWIGTTSNVTLRFEVGPYSQTCYNTQFGLGGPVCVRTAEITGAITVGVENAAIAGVATSGGPLAIVNFWLERYIERGDNGCPITGYTYGVKGDSGELRGSLISSCEGYTRTLELVMRPAGNE